MFELLISRWLKYKWNKWNKNRNFVLLTYLTSYTLLWRFRLFATSGIEEERRHFQTKSLDDQTKNERSSSQPGLWILVCSPWFGTTPPFPPNYSRFLDKSHDRSRPEKGAVTPVGIRQCWPSVEIQIIWKLTKFQGYISFTKFSRFPEW